MTKTAALTQASALDQARAELARRMQRRDAELAQYGPARDNDISEGNRHLQQRYKTHQALIRQAQGVVNRLKFADTLAQVKAAAQAAVEQAQAKVKARETSVQPAAAAAALEEAKARATALEGQISALEASRFAGLEVAQAALAQCTAAGDQAGAAAAAEEIVRIESEAATVPARLRPLQLQLSAVEDLTAAAKAKLGAAERTADEADDALFDANLEVLAIARDEAALVFGEAHIAYELANVGTRRRTKGLRTEFIVGASNMLLRALGKSVGDTIGVDAPSLQRDRQERQAIDESIFAVDPLTLEDAATRIARDKADPRHLPRKIDMANRADAYASVKDVSFEKACRDLGFVDLGYTAGELAGLQGAHV